LDLLDHSSFSYQSFGGNAICSPVFLYKIAVFTQIFLIFKNWSITGIQGLSRKAFLFSLALQFIPAVIIRKYVLLTWTHYFSHKLVLAAAIVIFGLVIRNQKKPSF